MDNQMSKPSASRFLSWFNPVGRQAGGIGFIVNRLAGLGLTLYLLLHLIMLGKLAQGPEAYDSFIAMAHSPLFLIGELLVVAAVFIHGLNGVRIILNSFGIAVPQQKQIFYVLMAIAIIITVYFAISMISHL